MALKRVKGIREMAHDLANTIEHGECFYGETDFEELLTQINDLKSACESYRVSVLQHEEAE